MNTRTSSGMLVDPDTGEIDPDGTDDKMEIRRLEVLIVAAFDANEEAKGGKRDYDRAMGVGKDPKPGTVRRYILDHPDVELADNERRIYADVSWVADGADKLDVRNLAAGNPDTLVWLAEQGLLQLNNAAWKGCDKEAVHADTVKGYIRPASQRLKVELKKREE